MAEVEAEVSDYTRAARVLLKAASDDKGVRARLRTTLASAAKPLGQYVKVAGGKNLPQRGGLGFRVASTTGIRVDPTRTHVTLRLVNKWGLKAIDEGTIRHPIFGHRDRPWGEEHIWPNAFTRPFEEGAHAVETALEVSLGTLAEEIAREIR